MKASAMMPSPEAPFVTGRLQLDTVLRQLVGDRRIILAGNRGPVEFFLTPDGHLRAQRSHGGVVSGLNAVSQFAKVTCVSSAMGEADRRAAQDAQGGRVSPPFPLQNLAVRFVVCNRNAYHKYYNVISNPLLWFLQHYMWNSPYTPNIDANSYDAWENGYVTVNRAFAEAIVDEMADEATAPLAMIHDYQLYMVAGMVREMVPNAILHHFIHVPWPSSGSWRLLPSVMRTSILDGLLANDIVAFQCERSVRDFLYTVEAFLPDAELDTRSRTITYKGRVTGVRAYPVCVDTAQLQRTASSPRVREFYDRLLEQCGAKTIVRVDRVDPSRNIVRGFRAYEMLLERFPQFRGEVRFLAFLTPSRTRVREYQRYGEELALVVNAINTRFGTPSWQPVTLFSENNYLQALAALRLYDVLLVNPVAEGTNLVAKEGPVLNQKDGIVILSEGSGVYDQLQKGVIGVTPTDLEGTVKALHRGLTMDAEERKSVSIDLRRLVEEDDVTTWLARQFADLHQIVGGQAGTLPTADSIPQALPAE